MLHAARAGDESAQRRLFESVYQELRALARSRLSRESTLTLLSPTSLVHESYVRMLGNTIDNASNRSVFFGYACKVMRSVIVDYVRERGAEKRGGGQHPVTLLTEIEGQAVNDQEVLAIHEALVQLREIDARCHDVVEMRYFGGFTVDECAAQLGVSSMTIARDWEKARLFLSYQLGR
jgi:RNA polymerase sigma factor (TIGR02999 family)